MNVTDRKNKEGFTIIEVVLVLAIAALIFLMVFIALPALQRNQRDTARKTILGKVTSAVTSYQSNNRGNNPISGTTPQYTKFAGYVDGTATTDGVRTQNGEYIVTISAFTGTPPTISAKAFDDDATLSGAQEVRVITGAKCDNDGAAAVEGNTREAAALIGMENGGASLCQNV